MAYDLITIGRVGVDLYPDQIGVHLADVKSFSKFLGGSPTNVAVAAARYGHRCAVVTKVGADGFGDYVRKALTGFDVDNRWVSTDPTLRTPVVFCEIFPPDHFPILFYRQPKGPDLNLTLADVDLDEAANASILWTTGTGLCEEPSRTTTLEVLEQRGRRRYTIHDLDYREVFWPSPAEAGRWQRQALSHATVAVGNRTECAVAVGEGSAETMGRRLLGLGVEMAIVKMGPDGVLVMTADLQEVVAPVSIEVVNGLGAGDAFGGALCHGLLEGWDLVETIRFANAAGAYVAGQLACADAMPTEDQVRELLGQKRVTT
ncbi:MAG TPA: 5-dehydro-2-deoxygluconokinase [Acidimicrobiia bacterium]|nr:5-dehydro-2-deoxygluconokinase [Acidimicrobiia bacterium]